MTEDKIERKSHGSSFFNGLALGVALGAVGFFLFGTKKGRRVKEKLLDGSRKVLKELEENAEKWEEKGKQIKEQTLKIKEKLAVGKQKLEKKAKHALHLGKRFFRKNGKSLR